MSTEVDKVDGDEDLLEFLGDQFPERNARLQYRYVLASFVSSPDTAVELQTGETPVEISVDNLRLRIWEIFRPWNWGVRVKMCTR